MTSPDPRPRIAFVSSLDPRDRRSWSGILGWMLAALEEHAGDVTILGPAHPGPLATAGGALGWALARASGRSFLRHHTWTVSGSLGRTFGRLLQGDQFDVAFAPIGSAAIARLETDIPIVYSSDATFRLVEGYYPRFSGLAPSSARAAERLEAAAIARAAAVLYPSQWAARSAIDSYRAPAAKVHVIPYGANLARDPGQVVASEPSDGRWQLLFLGVDWKRKGGELALGAVEELTRRGRDVELVVCGTEPDRQTSARVTVVPFLDKNVRADADRLEHLLASCQLLLLPTRAECYGIVFCEAAAYGMPSVTTATGGVTEIVQDGVNGVALPLGADAAGYADAIDALMADPAAYRRMRERARRTFEERFNWDAWGRATAGVVDSLVVRR